MRYSDVLANKALALGFNATLRVAGVFSASREPTNPGRGAVGRPPLNLQGRSDLTLSNSVKGFVRLGYNHQERFGGFQNQQADSAIADVATGLDINVGSPGLVNLRAFYVNEDFDTDNVNVPDPFTSFVSNSHHTRATTMASPPSGRGDLDESSRASPPAWTFASSTVRTSRTSSTLPTQPWPPTSSARARRAPWVSSAR